MPAEGFACRVFRAVLIFVLESISGQRLSLSAGFRTVRQVMFPRTTRVGRGIRAVLTNRFLLPKHTQPPLYHKRENAETMILLLFTAFFAVSHIFQLLFAGFARSSRRPRTVIALTMHNPRADLLPAVHGLCSGYAQSPR